MKKIQFVYDRRKKSEKTGKGMIGHKDIKTTQIYAKILKTTIERNVIEKML